MKVASKIPTAIESVVYVTKEQYEVWYAKPVSLGKIDKRGDYWYTTDGMRFISSRDAMRYLIRLLNGPTEKPVQPIQKSISEGKLPPYTLPTTAAKATTPPPPSVKQKSIPVNQNHPAFQQFLEFIEFSARRKLTASGNGRE